MSSSTTRCCDASHHCTVRAIFQQINLLWGLCCNLTICSDVTLSTTSRRAHLIYSVCHCSFLPNFYSPAKWDLSRLPRCSFWSNLFLDNVVQMVHDRIQVVQACVLLPVQWVQFLDRSERLWKIYSFKHYSDLTTKGNQGLLNRMCIFSMPC